MMIESSEDNQAVAQPKPLIPEDLTRVSTKASHYDGPKQLHTIREAAALVLTLTGATFLNVCKPRSLALSVYLQTLQTFSAQAVVILLPTISKDLNIPELRQQWVVSAFSLTLGCFLVCVRLLVSNASSLLPFSSPWSSRWRVKK